MQIQTYQSCEYYMVPLSNFVLSNSVSSNTVIVWERMEYCVFTFDKDRQSYHKVEGNPTLGRMLFRHLCDLPPLMERHTSSETQSSGFETQYTLTESDLRHIFDYAQRSRLDERLEGLKLLVNTLASHPAEFKDEKYQPVFDAIVIQNVPNVETDVRILQAITLLLEYGHVSKYVTDRFVRLLTDSVVPTPVAQIPLDRLKRFI